MPLTPEDNTRLYSDAFSRTAKAMMGEQSFAFADLKAQFDVAQMQIGVLQDELGAAQAAREIAERLHDEIAVKFALTAEGIAEAAAVKAAVMAEREAAA